MAWQRSWVRVPLAPLLLLSAPTQAPSKSAPTSSATTSAGTWSAPPPAMSSSSPAVPGRTFVSSRRTPSYRAPQATYDRRMPVDRQPVAAIELEGLVKTFGPVRALNRVDLTVPQGAITVLL